MNSLDGEVLDIGCGYGNYSELFGKKYMGIDKSASTIEKAKKLYPDRIFEIMDATDLKLENNKFGLILSVLTLHHIEDNEVIKAAQEMERVLRNNGRILIIDLALPQNLKILAYPTFYIDGAIKRTSAELSGLLIKGGLDLQRQELHRYINVGVSILEFAK